MQQVLASIGAIQILIMLVALVRSKLLSTLLGPANFGIVSTVDQTITSIVQLSALGLPFTAMKFMARSHSRTHEDFARTYASFFRAMGTLSMIAVIGVGAALLHDSALFGRDLAVYRNYFLVALLGVPALMYHIFFVNTLASAQRGAASAAMNMFILLALAVASVVGILVHGITGLYFTIVPVGACAALMAAWYLNRSLHVHPFRHDANILAELRENPEIIGYALLIYAAMSAYSLTMLATRYYVFGGLGAEGAGLLQALLGIALTVGAVMTPMNALFLTPYVNRQIPVTQKVAASNDFARTILILLTIGGVAVSLFPSLALTILYSPKFVGGAEALFLFVLWQCLYQFVNVYLQLLIGLDDVLYYSIITCVGYGVAAVLFPIAISHFGLGGAAIALASSAVVSAIGVAVRLRLNFEWKFELHVLLRAGFCIAAIIAAGMLFHPGNELTFIGAAQRGGYLLAIIGVLAASLSARERMLLVQTSARVRASLTRRRPQG